MVGGMLFKGAGCVFDWKKLHSPFLYLSSVSVTLFIYPPLSPYPSVCLFLSLFVSVSLPPSFSRWPDGPKRKRKNSTCSVKSMSGKFVYKAIGHHSSVKDKSMLIYKWLYHVAVLSTYTLATQPHTLDTLL